MKYTHNNNELRISDVKKEVYLKGWVQRVRNLGSLLFIDLRDITGIVQLNINPSSTIYNEALKLRAEYVVEVKGIVKERESKNPNMDTGDIEIDVTYLSILSEALTPPIPIDENTKALEDTRLRYRYLDLRRHSQANYLIIRNKIAQSIRRTLLDSGYIEFETPILGKSTPEGARDYLVPSRIYNGEFFALPQSPQIYKQLLMIAGMEKYFQLAKCFRDEDLRSDRQPEFTQVDIEASFIDTDDIILLTENIITKLFKEVLNINLTTPFTRITYEYAMTKYGSDKPDTRYDLFLSTHNELIPLVPFFKDSECVRGILVKNSELFTRKKLDEYQALVKKNNGSNFTYIKKVDGVIVGGISKFVPDFKIEEGYILFLTSGKFIPSSNALGALRKEIAIDLKLIDDSLFNFLWVVDWPLLEYDETEGRYYPTHHPFTAPKSVDELRDNPDKALADQYDIVLNGYELGGGSIRIHNTKVQELMFKTLSLTDDVVKERFGFFVDALKYGTPPHGGIALGLDRIVMLMTKTSNIKDVIAFPKTQSTKDLMNESPSNVDEKQLNELGIKVK
jgi:aspartyl-tRNA synthetase